MPQKSSCQYVSGMINCSASQRSTVDLWRKFISFCLLCIVLIDIQLAPRLQLLDQIYAHVPLDHSRCTRWSDTWVHSVITTHYLTRDWSVENGCLHYIPGSHKWDLLPITSRHFNNMDSIKEVLTPAQLVQFENRKPMLLKVRALHVNTLLCLTRVTVAIERTRVHSPRTHGPRLVRQQFKSASPSSRRQCVPRRHQVRQRWGLVVWCACRA